MEDGGIRFLGKPRDIFAFKQLEAVLNHYGMDFNSPITSYSSELIDTLMKGSGTQKYAVTYEFRSDKVTYQHNYKGLRIPSLNSMNNLSPLNNVKKPKPLCLRLVVPTAMVAG